MRSGDAVGNYKGAAVGPGFVGDHRPIDRGEVGGAFEQEPAAVGRPGDDEAVGGASTAKSRRTIETVGAQSVGRTTVGREAGDYHGEDAVGSDRDRIGQR